MEIKNKLTKLEEDNILIELAYSEKRGREVFVDNPYTCYVTINGPRPNLVSLTECVLDELVKDYKKSFIWAKHWDKTVISISPLQNQDCCILSSDDLKGKMFVPVSTSKFVDQTGLSESVKSGSAGIVMINSQEMTIDGFLICYLHMVNELIWVMAQRNSDNGVINENSYSYALDAVREKGFEVAFVDVEGLLRATREKPETFLRVYGSNVNKKVPKIMGAVTIK